jgi:ribosome-associated translation inhibitor RaiA
MITNCTANDGFEISPQFRRTIEERIARLERDAEHDEALVASLIDGDHIRRQTRLPRPMIAL